jgi:hypothetical protein
MVGDRTGRHPGRGGGLEHLADTARPVEHRVLGVRMQMYKTHYNDASRQITRM